MQQAAVLEVGDQRMLALHTHRQGQKNASRSAHLGILIGTSTPTGTGCLSGKGFALHACQEGSCVQGSRALADSAVFVQQAAGLPALSHGRPLKILLICVIDLCHRIDRLANDVWSLYTYLHHSFSFSKSRLMDKVADSLPGNKGLMRAAWQADAQNCACWSRQLLRL